MITLMGELIQGGGGQLKPFEFFHANGLMPYFTALLD